MPHGGFGTQDNRFDWFIDNDLEFLIVPGLLDDGILVAFTTRNGGISDGPFSSLNLSHKVGDDIDSVHGNIESVKRSWGHHDIARLLTLDQVHGTNIIRVGDIDINNRAGTGADAVLVDGPSDALMLHFADCLPVILIDKRHKRLVTIHAGWRGLADGITGKAVRLMIGEGSKSDDIEAYFGPSIRGCCFEVQGDIAARLGSDAGRTQKIDLTGVAEGDIIGLGVPAENIFDCDICTCCHEDRFFSYRRDGEKTGRQASIVKII